MENEKLRHDTICMRTDIDTCFVGGKTTKYHHIIAQTKLQAINVFKFIHKLSYILVLFLLHNKKPSPLRSFGALTSKPCL